MDNAELFLNRKWPRPPAARFEHRLIEGGSNGVVTFNARPATILSQTSTSITTAAAPCYTRVMLDELTFRRYADADLDALKKSLIIAEEGGEFEVEENSGALNVIFEEPPGKFVITPDSPVRQISGRLSAVTFCEVIRLCRRYDEHPA